MVVCACVCACVARTVAIRAATDGGWGGGGGGRETLGAGGTPLEVGFIASGIFSSFLGVSISEVVFLPASGLSPS